MSITLEAKMVLRAGGRQWAPDQKEVENKRFMSISKWNRGFVRFMTGKALDLRKEKQAKSGSVDSPFMQKLLDARQEAADKLLQEALTVEDESQQPTKKRKVARASRKHAIHVPNTMEMEMSGYTLTLLFEGVGSSNVWVEMTEDNCNWLKTQIAAASPRARQPRSSRKNTEAGSAQPVAEGNQEEDDDSEECE